MKKLNTTTISKYLSFILRHHPEEAGLTLDSHGWANVGELLRGVEPKYPLTLELLEEIVATDEKQRYSFSDDKTLIRANQGHSINVDVDLREAMPPEFLWHGTAERFADSIEARGLLKMNRMYVHLSSDCETAVKVGSRHGKPLVYKVSAAKMTADGYKFYLSANNVWLTDSVPARYLERTDNETTRV